MKILQLTKKLPFPLTSGEAWAVTALAKGLKAGGAEIDLFTLYPNQKIKVSNEDEEVRQKLLSRTVYSEVEIVDTTISTTKRGALENLVTKASYHADRFDHQVVKEALASWMQRHRYQAVLVETIYMMHYVDTIKKLNPDIKVLLRAHNVEHVIWERYAEGLGTVKSWYFKEQSKRLKAWESKVMAEVDLILPVSEHDASVIRDLLYKNKSNADLLVAPIGMEARDHASQSSQKEVSSSITLGYIGLLDWRPNVEGLQWFLREVWPVIIDKYPMLMLRIAGKNGGDLKLPNAKGVQLVGEVEDSDRFLRSVDVMIAPLLSGSGTRVKILQALRVQVPVICTSLAKEGLLLRHRQEVLIADTGEEWLEAIASLIDEETVRSSFREDMIVRGKQYLVEHHDSIKIAQSILAAISDL